jgi:hypothetical protein
METLDQDWRGRKAEEQSPLQQKPSHRYSVGKSQLRTGGNHDEGGAE